MICDGKTENSHRQTDRQLWELSSDRRGMDAAFLMLCPRHIEPLTITVITAPTTTRLWEIYLLNTKIICKHLTNMSSCVYVTQVPA